MNARVLVPVALLALAVLGAIWFLQNFEQMPVKERVGPSGEARVRDFLAAERFAERMGLPARELRSLVDLDSLPVGGVLLLPNRRQAIDSPRITRLLTWVQAGGHVIAEAEFPGVDDPLLGAVGISRETRRPLTRRRTPSAKSPRC